MYVYEIKVSHLKAANVFSSKEKIRYYLNGVLFDLKDNKLNLVSTCGQALIVIKTNNVDFKNKSVSKNDNQFIIPSHVIDKLKLNKFDTVTLTVNKMVNKCFLSFSYFLEKEVFECESIDANFPDYQSVIPDFSGISKYERKLCFDPVLINKFQKANKILGLGKQKLTIESKKDDYRYVVKIAGYDIYTGVLMASKP